MTKSEAEHKAEEMLRTLVLLMDQLDAADMKVINSFNHLLEMVLASRTGLIEPDQPLGVAWSLRQSVSLPELIRSTYIPTRTNLPAKQLRDIAYEVTNGQSYESCAKQCT